MKFTKMHGIGNDYVYVETFRPAGPGRPRPPGGGRQRPPLRHRLRRPDPDLPSERADARMRMFNADGSEGEMCGNGIRCVAKYLYDHGLARKDRVTIETGRGVLTLDLEIREGKVDRVRVDMGAADPRRPPRSRRSCPATRPSTRPSESTTAPWPSRPSRWATRTRWSSSTT